MIEANTNKINIIEKSQRERNEDNNNTIEELQIVMNEANTNQINTIEKSQREMNEANNNTIKELHREMNEGMRQSNKPINFYKVVLAIEEAKQRPDYIIQLRDYLNNNQLRNSLDNNEQKDSSQSL